MSEKHEEFHALMREVRQGSPEAARRLEELCGPRVIRVVRRKLAKRMRTQYDSTDFLQDAWASFFADPPDEHAFDRPEDVIAHLAGVATNKVLDACRRRAGSMKRDLKREEPLESDILDPSNDTPSKMALAQDQWDYLLRTQPPHYRRILLLLREGHKYEEIARELTMDVSTVRRVVCRLAAKVSS